MSTLNGNQNTENKEEKRYININELTEEYDNSGNTNGINNINDISFEEGDNYFKQKGWVHQESTSESDDKNKKSFIDINDTTSEKTKNPYKNSLEALNVAYKNIQSKETITSSLVALGFYFERKEEEAKKAESQEKSPEKLEKEALNLAKEYVCVKKCSNILKKEYDLYTKRVEDYKEKDKIMRRFENEILVPRRRTYKGGIESLKNDIRELIRTKSKNDSELFKELGKELRPLLQMDAMPSKEQMTKYYNDLSGKIDDYKTHAEKKSPWRMLWGMTGRKRYNLVKHLEGLLRDGAEYRKVLDENQKVLDDYLKEGEELTKLQTVYGVIKETGETLDKYKKDIKKETEAFGKTAPKEVQDKMQEITRTEKKDLVQNKSEQPKKTSKNGWHK